MVKVSSDYSHSMVFPPAYFGFIEGPWDQEGGEHTQQEVLEFHLCGDEDFLNKPPEIHQRGPPSPFSRSPADFCPDGRDNIKAEVNQNDNSISNTTSVSTSFDNDNGNTIITWKLSDGLMAEEAVVKAGRLIHVHLFNEPTTEGTLTQPKRFKNGKFVDISFIGLCARCGNKTINVNI